MPVTGFDRGVPCVAISSAGGASAMTSGAWPSASTPCTSSLVSRHQVDLRLLVVLRDRVPDALDRRGDAGAICHGPVAARALNHLSAMGM